MTDAPIDFRILAGAGRARNAVRYNIFGEMALVDAPRSATVAAVTEVKLVPWVRNSFFFTSAIRPILRSMFCASWRSVCVHPIPSYEFGRCLTNRRIARETSRAVLWLLA